MNLPALCIRRPVMTTSVTVGMVVVGLMGPLFLPVAALPKVDYPTISVSISLPGASPATMAASVASPLEREFAAIAGVDSITSVSGLGVGRITVQFNLNRNIDAAAQDIQAAIASASRKLPVEAKHEEHRKDDLTAAGKEGHNCRSRKIVRAAGKRQQPQPVRRTAPSPAS